MYNLIPHFIHNNFKKNNLTGDFQALTMFMDISGFTPMTEALMQHGKQGAEILSGILNETFYPVIKAVYDNGGFISGFAGDAFTALFPISEGTNSHSPLQAALTIRQIFAEHGVKHTAVGDFPLEVKLGLSQGDITWGIVGNDNHKAYYFRGSGVDTCAKAEHFAQKGDIILTEGFRDSLLTVAGEGHYLWPASSSETLTGFVYPQMGETLPALEVDTAKQFYPASILTAPHTGEFREVASCFISFKGIETHEQLDQFVSTVLSLVDQFEGYFNRLDFGDKGGNMLIFFGCPTGHENDLERAFDFVLALKKQTGAVSKTASVSWRAGIAFGSMYAGIVGIPERCEYTTLGNAVNFSARLMMKADFGEVLVAESLAKYAKFKFEHKGDFQYKGFSQAVPTYQLMAKKSVYERFQADVMIGRQAELKQLQTWSQPIFEGKFAGITYIYGEAGMGKSRLIFEYYHHLENVTWFSCQCDSILKQPFNPFVYLLKRYFEQDSLQSVAERKAKFEAKYVVLVERVENLTSDQYLSGSENVQSELIRTKSFLGAMLGLHWEGSLYEQLDPKLRYENTLQALKTFFFAHTMLQPVILEIEDLHWVDSDSLNFMEDMLRSVEGYPMFIIVSSRYHDDGSKPRLLKEETLRVFETLRVWELDLNHLSDTDLQALIEHEIDANAHADLFEFLKSKTQGNPFFTQQMVRYMQENELLEGQLSAGIERLTLKESAELEMPSQLNALLIARLDRLSRDLKEIVQTASVIGREFQVDILMKVLKDINMVQIEKGEEEQVWSQISELQYIFKHVLLRDAAYEMQLKSRLKVLHYTVADAIETMYVHDLTGYYPDLAFHFEKAEIIDNAIEYYEKAGDHAKANYQNEEALFFYDRLMDNVAAISNGDKRDWKSRLQLETIDKKLDILYVMGDFDTIRTTAEEGLAFAQTHDLPIWQAKCYHWQGMSYQIKAEYQQSLESCDKGLTLLNEHPDDSIRIKLLNTVAWAYARQGQFEQVQRLSHEAITLSEKINDIRGLRLSYTQLGWIYFELNQYEPALDYFEKATMLAKQSGDMLGISSVMNSMANVYNRMGQNEKALSMFQEVLQIARETGNRHMIAMALGNMGIVYTAMGDYDTATECLEKGLKQNQATGSMRSVSFGTTNLGVLYYHKGDYDKALELVEKGLALKMDIDIPLTIGYNYAYIAMIHVRKNQPEHVLQTAMTYFKHVQEIETDFAQGRVHAAVGWALAETPPLAPPLQREGKQNPTPVPSPTKREGQDVPSPSGGGLVWGQTMQAITALTGLLETPEAYFEESLKTERMDALVPNLILYGSYLHEAGKHETAVEKWQLAKDKATEASMRPELAELDEICQELGIVLA